MSDPFVTGLFGGLPKTETCASVIFTGGTTARGNRNGPVISSLGRETKLSSARPREMLSSHGATRAIAKTEKSASSAAFSETKARTSRLSLSDRLTLSLISSGLVCGITPSLTRKQSGQPIQVLALNTPVGVGAAKAGKDFSYSSGSDLLLSKGQEEGNG